MKIFNFIIFVAIFVYGQNVDTETKNDDKEKNSWRLIMKKRIRYKSVHNILLIIKLQFMERNLVSFYS